MSQKKLIRISLIIFAVLFSAYAFFWYWSALKVVTILDQEIVRLKEHGLDIRYESQRTMGFPSRLKLKLKNIVVYPEIGEAVSPLFRAKEMSLAASMINPISFVAGQISQENNNLHFDLADLDKIVFTAKDVRFQQGSMTPLADTLNNLEIQLNAHGPLALNGDTIERLKVWQQGQGYLDISMAAIRWAELFMDGHGKLALDPSMQLTGKLDTNTTGLPNFLTGLGKKGIIDRNVAGLAAGSIQFFSVPVENKLNGKVREFFSVPMSFVDGEYYLGPLRLAKLGPIVD
ncbi:DUF2125 domain-containing protein [Curvivirga aplysinae]|uniref:DUF2125 domain-containing protein n=1 Tax=Curvivirga aplysinae TaxID=2529852 RepID=UPI0012BC6DEF|nr:DUF2125 domain-containing protein [Curvivirga aplysinae]MTI08513.1 DUF2125 domain-containing protein [Curvivirga aplysinae]